MLNPNLPTDDPEVRLNSRADELSKVLKEANIDFKTSEIPGHFMMTRGNHMISVRAARSRGSTYTVNIIDLAKESGGLTVKYPNTPEDVLSLIKEVPVGEIQQTTVEHIAAEKII